MEQQLLELLNQYGIIRYTFIICLVSIIVFFIYDLLLNLSNYIFERALYYRDRRKLIKKELKDNE